MDVSNRIQLFNSVQNLYQLERESIKKIVTFLEYDIFLESKISSLFKDNNYLSKEIFYSYIEKYLEKYVLTFSKDELRILYELGYDILNLAMSYNVNFNKTIIRLSYSIMGLELEFIERYWLK